MFEGLEENDFSFGNESFQPRKSFKKLTLKKYGNKSGSASLNSSVIDDPEGTGLREEDQSSERYMAM